jgi:hypothetical protein
LHPSSEFIHLTFQLDTLQIPLFTGSVYFGLKLLGQDAPMSVLVDLIYNSEASEDGYYGNFSDHEVTFGMIQKLQKMVTTAKMVGSLN